LNKAEGVVATVEAKRGGRFDGIDLFLHSKDLLFACYTRVEERVAIQTPQHTDARLAHGSMALFAGHQSFDPFFAPHANVTKL
jgi:hypothetical protein